MDVKSSLAIIIGLIVVAAIVYLVCYRKKNGDLKYGQGEQPSAKPQVERSGGSPGDHRPEADSRQRYDHTDRY